MTWSNFYFFLLEYLKTCLFKKWIFYIKSHLQTAVKESIISKSPHLLISIVGLLCSVEKVPSSHFRKKSTKLLDTYFSKLIIHKYDRIRYKMRSEFNSTPIRQYEIKRIPYINRLFLSIKLLVKYVISSFTYRKRM